MLKKLLVIIIALSAFTKASPHKSDTLYISENKSVILKDTANDCTAVTGSRSVYKDINLYLLKDSTVRFLKNDVSGELNIKDIRTIKFKGRGFMKGAVIGYAIGFVSGFILGCQDFGFSNEFNFGDGMLGGFIVGIPFALIGGGLGSLFAEDRLYDLGNLDLDSKRKIILYLMKENPDR